MTTITPFTDACFKAADILEGELAKEMAAGHLSEIDYHFLMCISKTCGLMVSGALDRDFAPKLIAQALARAVASAVASQLATISVAGSMASKELQSVYEDEYRSSMQQLMTGKAEEGYGSFVVAVDAERTPGSRA